MSRKAICPICGAELRLPGNWSVFRSRIGWPDRVYFYHRRAGGSWCPSNGGRVVGTGRRSCWQAIPGLK